MPGEIRQPTSESRTASSSLLVSLSLERARIRLKPQALALDVDEPHQVRYPLIAVNSDQQACKIRESPQFLPGLQLRELHHGPLLEGFFELADRLGADVGPRERPITRL